MSSPRVDDERLEHLASGFTQAPESAVARLIAEVRSLRARPPKGLNAAELLELYEWTEQPNHPLGAEVRSLIDEVMDAREFFARQLG